jgi:hypothetical protein
VQQLKKERRGEGREGKEGNSISTSVSHTHTHTAPPPLLFVRCFYAFALLLSFLFQGRERGEEGGSPSRRRKGKRKTKEADSSLFFRPLLLVPLPDTHTHPCVHDPPLKKKNPKVETNMPQRGEGKKKKEAERTPDGGAASECNQQTHKTSRAHASHKPPLLLFPFLHPLNIHMQTPSKKKRCGESSNTTLR